jgi:uncharacterized protein (TIGR03435 family)
MGAMRKIVTWSAGLLWWATAAWSQSTSPKPAFEVATIKPSLPAAEARRAGVRQGITVDGARAQYGGLSLLILVVQAYGMRGPQVIAPEWMNATRYDILAKLPDGASPEQAPEMLQSLLEDRFKLTYHRETKEFPVYVLVPGKGELRLTERPADYDPASKTGPRLNTMAQLARRMEQAVDLQVVDLTGIKGEYMVDTSSLNADISAQMMRVIAPQRDGAVTPGGETGRAAFQLAEKLGLKLEARKVPLPVMIIDHMEKTPTEN